MPKHLEGDMADINELLHHHMTRLKARADMLAAKVPADLHYEADDLAHEIENVKLLIGNHITSAVLSSQMRRGEHIDGA